MVINKKCAILVVSFGTTHLDTLERSIVATEEKIAKSFLEYPVYRAFLSPMIRKKLRERHGLKIDDVAEALGRIEADGYRQVIIQPTLLLRGIEFELLLKESEKTNLTVFIGRSLLENNKDCEALADIIISENPLKEKEALVLMGHGTEHEANGVYHNLQEIFEKKGYPCFLGTVEGTPTFEDAVEKLAKWGAVCAKLMPLMLVAGDHAKHDMAGEENSLLSMVKKAGISVEPIFRGLGESSLVQNIYKNRVQEALKEMESCS